MSKQFQWFPGHMAKALHQIQDQIQSVDIVLELVDARSAYSCLNPVIDKMIENKKVIIGISKTDLADPIKTKKIEERFKQEGNEVILLDNGTFNYAYLKNLCNNLLKEKFEKDKAKGLRKRPIRLMILGIPNVGKSTLINKIAKRKAAVVENRPGVTKGQQFIKVDEDFILLDTPGVLWPNFEDKRVGINLAMLGSIKQSILPLQDLIFELLKFITHDYPSIISKHYNVEEIKVDTNEDCMSLLYSIGQQRKYILNDDVDLDRTAITIINEFQAGKLGKLSIEG